MIKQKFDSIINWYSSQIRDEVCILNTNTDESSIGKIEELTGEKFPEDLRQLYKFYNGETGEGRGTFLGHSFVSLEEIVHSLHLSKSLIIPSNPKVTNPDEAERIIKSIIEVYKANIPAEYKTWYKIEFQCSPNSHGGPYIYATKETTDRERKGFRLASESSDAVFSLAKELHKLEAADYNWNELNICFYSTGEFAVNRTFFNFDENPRLASFPEKAIKKKYFHIKWIPLLSDGGGNYIGMDLDPDEKGVKGQIIVFGRDEEKMFVIANSLESFFDFALEQIDKDSELFLSENHLHDEYKTILLVK